MHSYTHKVQYYETDAMGIVHHSNYIRWFEECRTDFMEQAGFGYADMEKAGVVSPVIEISCAYKASVRYGDTVKVDLTIGRFTGAQMVVCYQVTDAADGRLRASGKTRHCFLNTEGHPVSLKKTHPRVFELYSGYVTP